MMVTAMTISRKYKEKKALIIDHRYYPFYFPVCSHYRLRLGLTWTFFLFHLWEECQYNQ